MPYVNQPARGDLDALLTPLLTRIQRYSVGELNYVITRIVDTWLAKVGANYAAINQAIGVLECAKLELYRRVAAPYEDQKIVENGDVYVSGK